MLFTSLRQPQVERTFFIVLMSRAREELRSMMPQSFLDGTVLKYLDNKDDKDPLAKKWLNMLLMNISALPNPHQMISSPPHPASPPLPGPGQQQQPPQQQQPGSPPRSPIRTSM